MSYKSRGPDMSWNMVTIWKNFGVFVHPCPLALVEAMVCLESITARTSLSNWLVIDGSIPPDTLNTAQCKYTQIQNTHIQLNVYVKLSYHRCSPYRPLLHSTLCHIHTFTLNVAHISFHTLCILPHAAHCKCTLYTFFFYKLAPVTFFPTRNIGLK